MLEQTLHGLDIPPRGDYVRAFRDFTRAIHPGQDYDEHLRRADAALRLGDYMTALADTGWCLLHRPGSPQAELLHAKAAIGAAAVQLLSLPLVGRFGDEEPEPLQALLDEAACSLRRLERVRPTDDAVRLLGKVLHEIRSGAASIPA